MEWRDEGLIIGIRRHGETSVILEAMTRDHGRHLGLVRGGRSRRLQPALQPGNSLHLVWRARIDEHLGTFTPEPTILRAARYIDSALALAGIGHVGGLLRLLPERDPHEALFIALNLLAEHLDAKEIAPALLARFEVLVLAECGFGLDLGECAATGVRDDLAYVSPKSGRAVSRHAGAPWHEKLFSLPGFLRENVWSHAPSGADVADAFRITGHFLQRDVYAPRGLTPPDSRRAFLVAAGVAVPFATTI